MESKFRLGRGLVFILKSPATIIGILFFLDLMLIINYKRLFIIPLALVLLLIYMFRIYSSKRG